MKFDFSICTPVYNRAELLPRLYQSLLDNISDELCFEWLLIDDGSEDDIASFVNQVSECDNFSFRYIRKENQGKHSCLNIAFEQAQGELLLILDSDDLLANGSLNRVKELWQPYKNDAKIAGIIGHCLKLGSNELLGDKFPSSPMLSSILANSYQYYLAGDRCDFIRRQLLKDKRFPIIKSERFMPEAVVMQDFDVDYRYVCVNESFKIVEYQQGGLSDSYAKLSMKNPQGMLLRFERILNDKAQLSIVDFKAKIKMYGNYTRYVLHAKKSLFNNTLTIKKHFPLALIIGFFAGISLYVNDRKTLKD